MGAEATIHQKGLDWRKLNPLTVDQLTSKRIRDIKRMIQQLDMQCCRIMGFILLKVERETIKLPWL